MRFDVTLYLDRLLCQMFGHPGPHAFDEWNRRWMTQPWSRPRCRRCGTRLDRK